VCTWLWNSNLPIKLPYRFFSDCVNCVLSHSVWCSRLLLTHVFFSILNSCSC
jgi:hypothetical protein